MAKRTIDIMVALIGLIVLAPVFAIIAILIKLDSSGRVFFRGKRVGQDGKVFYILKFRSMVPDAHKKGTAITSKDDPRITRLGNILRKTKLDELPSLINVLKGDMSLVGPRPESPDWVERYTPQQRAALSVKPGITGLSQIKYRNEEALLSSANLEEEYIHIMNDKLSIDQDYLRNRSLALDLRILWETGAALLRQPQPIRDDGLFTGPRLHREFLDVMVRNKDLLKQYVRRIGLDFVAIPFAFCLAWCIRFDGHVPAEEWGSLIRHLLPIASVYVLINLGSGIYRRLWAYASFRDVVLLSETIGLATLLLIAVNFIVGSYSNHRLSTGGLIIGGFLTLALSTIVKYRRQLLDAFFVSRPRPGRPAPERMLIAGINAAAQRLATQIYLGNSQVPYEVVGYVDTELNGKGMNVNGVEILGTPDQIPTLVRDKEIDVIVIAHRPSDPEKMWRLISMCLDTTAKVKVLPDMVDVMEGRYEDPLTLRDVNIEDILGREPAMIDDESCERILANKVILVTGAAGSIGSELCRQILDFRPQLLLALDNNETGLYELNLELSCRGCPPLQLSVADVSDWQKLNRIFQEYRPQVVFHAAAYKHVPMLEDFPDEALRVNVMGTAIVSEMAHRHEAERFVFISTDKAVNPSSVMGASKRVGELWLGCLSEQSDTIFATVRFGNVVGSRGSVLPTFARQIELGGPVTVTHPEMTRFLMSIPEAVRLVLQAATFSQGGDVFMLEMGDEVSILNLAQRMIRLKGLRVNKDIEIEFVGIRPGEKIHEELTYGEESKQETPHSNIYRLQYANGSMDYGILVGVISILNHSWRMSNGRQLVREGIFHIAASDIDGFLNKVAGLDLTRNWRQLAGDRAMVGKAA